MRGLLIGTLVSFTLLILGCQQNGKLVGYQSFGAPIQTASAVSLADAVARVDDHSGDPVCIVAKIGDVCRNRGCWMLLTDGTHKVRVRFTASAQCTDGFLVPRNAAGHEVYARGVLKRDTIPEDLARHYAEEQGKATDEIERIVGPQPAISMVATGVMISDATTLDPPAQ